MPGKEPATLKVWVKKSNTKACSLGKESVTVEEGKMAMKEEPGSLLPMPMRPM